MPNKNDSNTCAPCARLPPAVTAATRSALQGPLASGKFVGMDLGDPVGPASFVELLRQFGADRTAAVAAIRIGFPARLLDDAASYFAVPTQRILAIVRMPLATAELLSRQGALLDAAASERLWRLADLMRLARSVFRHDARAKAWLRTPSPQFNDLPSMDFLDTEPGAIEVRQALTAIAAAQA